MWHKIALISFVLVAATFFGATRHAHATDLKIENESDFIFYMEKIADGTVQQKDSPDPNASNSNHIYLEITSDLTLTKPISISKNVHIKGNKNGAVPIITAFYNVDINTGKPPCIIAFVGDQVILENIQINANTYRPTSGSTKQYFVDNAICVNTNSNLINGVAINSPGATAPYGFFPLNANGINIMGSNTIVQNSNIILATSVGLVLHGKTSAVHDNTISTNYYSVLVEELGAIVTNNTITGKIGIIFPYPTSVPLGQAANDILLNTITNTDADWAKDLTSFPGRYEKTIEPGFENSLPQCGVCKDITTQKEIKIFYNDDATCKKSSEVCKNLLEGVKIESVKIPLNVSLGSQLGYVEKLPSDLQVYYAAPTDTTTATVDNDSTLSKQDATMPPTPQLDSKIQPDMHPDVMDGQAFSGGGCSLIRVE